MAAAHKSTRVKKARAVLTLTLAIGLLPDPLTVLNPLQGYPRHNRRLVGAATSSSTAAAATSDDYCDGTDWTEACFADAECSPCFSEWGAATSSAVSACEQQFPEAADGTACEQEGAAFCCNLGDQATADACMSNGLFVRFFTCFMEGFQCTIEDMPCHDGSAVSSIAEPPTTPPATSPTDTPVAPTASPTTPTSYADRSMDMTAAPSSSVFTNEDVTVMPSALSDACAGSAAACAADDDCEQGCYSGVVQAVVEATAAAGDGGSSYSQCQLRYLVEDERVSAGSASNVCDVFGSSFCCSGGGEEDEQDETGIASDAGETTAVDCLNNVPARDLWSCAFQMYDCSVEDATCIAGGGGDGSFVTSDDASSSSPLVEVPNDGDGGVSSVSGAMGLMERGEKGVELSSGLWVVVFYCLTLVLGLVATDI